MWIASKLGFFSIVAHRDQPGKVMVRSRVKQDLVNLIGAHWSSFEHGPKPEILTTPDADYRFRIILDKDNASSLMEELTYSIDYPNFKNEVANRPDQRDKLPAYGNLWSNLHNLQIRDQPSPFPTKPGPGFTSRPPLHRI